MALKIYAADRTTKKYELGAVLSSRLHEALNGECTFDLTMPGRRIPEIAVGDEIRLGELFFDVVRVSKQTQRTGRVYNVSCEHISYALADMEQGPVHYSGTPGEVLGEILSGTGFTAGTVTVSGTWSITINRDTSKREALQEWAAVCGAELGYSGRSIQLLARRGSSTPVNLAERENVISLGVTMDSRSETQTYAVELSRLQRLSIGDALHIRYASLNLDVHTRVLSLDYDPFHPMRVEMVTGDYLPDFTGTVTAALEARLREGEPYFGVTISREKGIEIARSDGASEAVFNSDTFAMRALIDGAMKDRIYFDPVKGDYVFDGALGADAVFADMLYAKTGDIADLTVDRLSTSRRIRKYILGDKSDDNYVKIQDQYVSFVTGTLVYEAALLTESGVPILTEDGEPLIYDVTADQAVTEQAVNRYGQGLYWQREPLGHTAEGYPTDRDGVQIYAGTEVTDWPVYVWKYLELVKASFAFEEYTLSSGENTYAPVIVLGAGDENGNSKGYFLREQNSMILRYVTAKGEETDISFTDFVDAKHRRLAGCEINTTAGTVTYTVEGDDIEYGLDFEVIPAEEEGDPDKVIFTWPDGHTCEVSVV